MTASLTAVEPSNCGGKQEGVRTMQVALPLTQTGEITEAPTVAVTHPVRDALVDEVLSLKHLGVPITRRPGGHISDTADLERQVIVVVSGRVAVTTDGGRRVVGPGSAFGPSWLRPEGAGPIRNLRSEAATELFVLSSREIRQIELDQPRLHNDLRERVAAFFSTRSSR